MKRGCVLGCITCLLLAGVLTTGPARGDEARDQFSFATGLLVKKEYELAAEEFGELLKDHPAFEEADVATYRLGEAFWHLGKKNEAVAAYRKVTQKFPKSDKGAEAYYRLGQALSETDHAAAASAYGTLAEKWPEHKLVEAAL